MRALWIATFAVPVFLWTADVRSEERHLSTFLTTTTTEIGRPYTVVDGACVYQQFESFSFSGDPLANAVTGAFRQMSDMAKRVGADALVGFDVDFASRPMKGEEGRVLLCGTLVTFDD